MNDYGFSHFSCYDLAQIILTHSLNRPKKIQNFTFSRVLLPFDSGFSSFLDVWSCLNFSSFLKSSAFRSII